MGFEKEIKKRIDWWLKVKEQIRARSSPAKDGEGQES
jgi:hypothetical protein